MTLSYSLDGVGWAILQWRDGETSIAMTASYLHDSLGELAQCMVDLEMPDSEARTPEVTEHAKRLSARVVLMNEPGEHQILFERREDAVAYEIRWFDDWESWDMHPSDRFVRVAEGVLSYRWLRQQVTDLLSEVYQEHGVEGYKEKWVEHDFPLRLFNRLLRKSRRDSNA